MIAQSVKAASDMTGCGQMIYDPTGDDQRGDGQEWGCRVRDDEDGLCTPKPPQEQREAVIRLQSVQVTFARHSAAIGRECGQARSKQDSSDFYLPRRQGLEYRR